MDTYSVTFREYYTRDTYTFDNMRQAFIRFDDLTLAIDADPSKFLTLSLVKIGADKTNNLLKFYSKHININLTKIRPV